MPRRARSRAAPAAASPAALFAALGDETRLGLVARLGGGGPMSIARLTSGSRVTRQAVRKHLGVLEAAGLVRGAQRGRESIWRLEPPRLADARRALDRIEARWDSALERLKAYAEE